MRTKTQLCSFQSRSPRADRAPTNPASAMRLRADPKAEADQCWYHDQAGKQLCELVPPAAPTAHRPLQGFREGVSYL
jgi:hypothetical protein